MNVVDSSGWLEYFSDAANASYFAPAIENERKLVVPSITLLEVYKVALRDLDAATAGEYVIQMKRGVLVAMDEKIALRSARLGLDLRLPLADSIILATAREHGATLWTQDEHFKGLPGVRFKAKRNKS